MFSSKAPFVGGRPDSFSVAEGDMLPVSTLFSFYSSELRFVYTKLRCNGPSKPEAHYHQLHRDCPVLLQQNRHLQRTWKEFTTKLLRCVQWKLTTLRNLIHNYTDGWWTLALDSIMWLIWCGWKSCIPCSSRIVATIGMALAFGYTVVCACSGSCASLKT